jgi:4,5-dihydroxyphthalate decarboxylase
MARVNLSLACSRYDRTEPILDGAVKPDGIDFVVTNATRPGEIFWRMLLFDEFDCSEMSLASFIVVKSQGKKNWEGLPVFTAKHFFHIDAMINVDSKIKEPADLEGKKVGVPEYQMSAAVWSRGVLHDEYGVRPEKIHWYMGRRRDLSREKATGMEAPSDIDLTLLEGATLGEALIKGELDAVLVYSTTPSLVDSANPVLTNNPRVKKLFDDPIAEAVRYYKKTGIFPINHTVVLKKDIAKTYPWAAINIVKCFDVAKRMAYDKWHELENWERFPSAIFISDSLLQQKRLFGDDPFANGYKANFKTIKTLARYLHEQGFVPDEPQIESLFAETTINL